MFNLFCALVLDLFCTLREGDAQFILQPWGGGLKLFCALGGGARLILIARYLQDSL